jgi:hypothetical protein
VIIALLDDSGDRGDHQPSAADLGERCGRSESPEPSPRERN